MIDKIKRPKHSGFDAPTYGTVYPKGTVFKKDKNGKLIPILPKNEENEQENGKEQRKETE